MRIEQHREFTWHVDGAEDTLIQQGLDLLYRQTQDERVRNLLLARIACDNGASVALPVETGPAAPPNQPQTEAQIAEAQRIAATWGNGSGQQAIVAPVASGDLPDFTVDGAGDDDSDEGWE